MMRLRNGELWHEQIIGSRSGRQKDSPNKSTVWDAVGGVASAAFALQSSLGLIGIIALGLVFLRLNVIGALADAGTPECRTGGELALCSTAAYELVTDR